MEWKGDLKRIRRWHQFTTLNWQPSCSTPPCSTLSRCAKLSKGSLTGDRRTTKVRARLKSKLIVKGNMQLFEIYKIDVT